MSASDEPKSAPRRYAVDERLVMPETRFEIVDGEVVYVSPADEPHGRGQSRLSALLETYSADGYAVAADMLTRTSEKNDMAPDGSVYPAARDPETGGRQLEELAFEVVSTQTLADAGTKAARLIGRGVRRVFALDVERQRALEWSTETAAWRLLRTDGVIEDPALAVPLVIDDLVGAARVDDAVARALLAKGNPILTDALDARERSGLARGQAEGKAEGKAEAVLAVLAARGLDAEPGTVAQIRACRDLPTLDRWLGRALTARSPDEVIDPAGD